MRSRSPIALFVAASCLMLACAGQPPASEQPAPESTQDSNATETATDIGPRLVDRATGEPAKEFELALFDGRTLRLADLRGNVVVLNFWVSWCPPCRAEMPAFERIWQEYRDQGVIFVGVAGVLDTEEDARAFAEKVGVTYLLGRDATGQISKDYRALTLPTTFIIDRQGNEVRKFGVANEGALRIFLKGQLGDG